MHQFQTIIQYDEIDICDVLYHANYIKLVDRARNAFYQDLGYSFKQQYEERVGFAIGRIECDYFSPLEVFDEVLITTKVLEVHPKRIKVTNTILKNNDVSFKSITDLIYVSLDERKSLTIPEWLQVKLRILKIG